MLRTIYTRILNDDRGAAIVEYAFLVLLIALVALIAVQIAGGELSLTYSEIASDVEHAGS